MVEGLGPEVLIHGRLEAEPEIDLRIRAQKGVGYGQTVQLAKTSRSIRRSCCFLMRGGGGGICCNG